MATTTAKIRGEADRMSAADRLWDSLNYSYGKKGESIGKEYDRLYSQTDNQMLGRGMQRSSYGAQTLANIGQRRAEALADNQAALIADYESRLLQAEQQDEANRQWEAQFQFQQEQADLAQQNWEKEFEQKYGNSGGGSGGGRGGSTPNKPADTSKPGLTGADVNMPFTYDGNNWFDVMNNWQKPSGGHLFDVGNSQTYNRKKIGPAQQQVNVPGDFNRLYKKTV